MIRFVMVKDHFMTHPLVGGSLRVLAVALALVLGCSSGHRAGTAGPVAACARTVDPVAAERHSAVAPPVVRILAALPQEATLAEEQEAPPSAVVRAARPNCGEASIPYNHAPDYQWLTGELRYSPARAVWCLHYAGPDEDDRHGGTVTLVAATPLTDLRSGLVVRVEGELLDSQSQEPSPPYQVRSVRSLPGD